MADPRIGSLCSGVGGLDLGLMAVIGGSVAWHVEYDKHPSAVLDARWPGVPNYGDLTTVEWTVVEPVDWLTAGYPCQPFSHAGKRKGSADERHLWPYVAGAIGALRPRRVLLENVAGHVSLGLDAVLWELAALGYDATWGVVRAADAGAPHGRARLFVVAADTRGERSVGRVDREDAGEAREWERPRPEPGDRSAAAPADADVCIGPWDGVPQPADGSRAPERAGEAEPRRRGGPASDAERGGRDGGAPEPERREVGRTVATGSGEVADPATDTHELGPQGIGRIVQLGRDPDGCGGQDVAWGVYEPAIRRWERVLGRAAPRPTERGGRGNERLSPVFVEWLMGLPAGWVTDILPRNPALKALGNGVVPQQAALAIRTLLSVTEAEVA